jgi:hypothetical protein
MEMVKKTLKNFENSKNSPSFLFFFATVIVILSIVRCLQETTLRPESIVKTTC